MATLALLVALAAGWLFLLNPEPVRLRLSPGRAVEPPLAGALLAAFAAGAGAAALVAAARELRAWRERRRARKTGRDAERTRRAEALLWTGAPTQARAALLRPTERVPADPARLALLAETYLHEGDPGGARALLDEGIARVGYAPRLLDLLAEAAERSGDLAAAGEALERARLVEPGSPRLTRRLRDVYVAGGRWDAALALHGELQLARRDTPVFASDLALQRGLQYEAALADATVDERRAVRRLLALAREAPTFVPAWVSAGDLYARAGRTFLARRAWERGARNRPAVVLIDRLADLHTRASRPERTVRLLRRLHRRHPDSPALTFLLARHLLAQGAANEAERLLDQLDPGPTTDLLRGETERRRGNVEQALDLLDRAASAALAGESAWRCEACQRATASWLARCPACTQWGTVHAAIERARAA